VIVSNGTWKLIVSLLGRIFYFGLCGSQQCQCDCQRAVYGRTISYPPSTGLLRRKLDALGQQNNHTTRPVRQTPAYIHKPLISPQIYLQRCDTKAHWIRLQYIVLTDDLYPSSACHANHSYEIPVCTFAGSLPAKRADTFSRSNCFSVLSDPVVLCLSILYGSAQRCFHRLDFLPCSTRTSYCCGLCKRYFYPSPILDIIHLAWYPGLYSSANQYSMGTVCICL
jgi:hypothetical protein